jgi:hypothetical protein
MGVTNEQRQGLPGHAVGSIAKRPVLIDGALEEREHLCLTLSFNHDIIDAAPAARFAGRFAERLASGEKVRNAMGNEASHDIHLELKEHS